MNISTVGATPASPSFSGTGTLGTKNGYRVHDSTPEEVFSGYDMSKVTEKDFGEITSELFLNQNDESRSIGRALVLGQMMGNPYVPETSGQNLFHFSGGGSVDLLGSILEKYKQQIALGNAGAENYLKLYQCLSEINRK